MRGGSAQLPVDFLVGFTIFILSFIMAANFVPSLLVGLQRTSGIDYDAVAYRTGVVLVEDPGEPAGNRIFGMVLPLDKRPWDQQEDIHYKDEIDRLGLAVSPDTPNVLSINKINRFFCTTQTGPSAMFFDDRFDSPANDYRSKLLFSTYQYGYNVTLQNISPMKAGDSPLKMMIGQPYPAGYGYIRRYVLVKQNTNATINLNRTFIPGTSQLAFDAYTSDQVKQELRIRLDGRVLYNKSIDPQYTIDLLREPFTIKITNLSFVLNRSDWNPSPIARNKTEWSWNPPPNNNLPTSATLTAINIYPQGSNVAIPGAYSSMNLTVDNGLPQTIPPAITPMDVKDTIELSVKPLWPPGTVLFDANNGLEIGFTFDNRDTFGNPLPRTLLSGTFLYDYNRTNVTQPVLSTGMLEVGIW